MQAAAKKRIQIQMTVGFLIFSILYQHKKRDVFCQRRKMKSAEISRKAVSAAADDAACCRTAGLCCLRRKNCGSTAVGSTRYGCAEMQHERIIFFAFESCYRHCFRRLIRASVSGQQQGELLRLTYRYLKFSNYFSPFRL